MTIAGVGLQFSMMFYLLAMGPVMPGNKVYGETEGVVASSREATVEVGKMACVPVERRGEGGPGEVSKTLVLRQLHAVGGEGGPFAVYLEPAGTKVRLDANRVGYFSLYSFAQRDDGQDLSFSLNVELAGRLFPGGAGGKGLQVCVLNRDPEKAVAGTVGATFLQAVVIAHKPD